MSSSRSDAVALIRTATSPSPVLGDHFGGRQRAIIFLRCREGACKFSPQPIERFLLCPFFFAPDQLADVFSDVLVRLICIDVRRHELGRRDVGPALRKSFCAGTVLNLCAFSVTDNKEDLRMSRATSWRRAGFRHGSPVFRRAAIKMLHAVIKFPPAQLIERRSVAQSCGCEDLAVQVSNLTPADGRPSGDVLSSSSLNACPMAVPTIVRLSAQNLSEKGPGMHLSMPRCTLVCVWGWKRLGCLNEPQYYILRNSGSAPRRINQMKVPLMLKRDGARSSLSAEMGGR